MGATIHYRCDAWPEPDRKQCPAEGVYFLLTPEGPRCPGGPYCERHAFGIIEEYQEKLGETWDLEAV